MRGLTRTGRQPAGAVIASSVAIALGVAACSSTTGDATGTTGGSTTSSAPRTTTAKAALARLPVSALEGTGAQYRVVVQASGHGSKVLGRYRVGAGPVLVQSACLGSGSFDVAGLFRRGPCTGGAELYTSTLLRSGTRRFAVSADPDTRWSVYVAQPR